MSLYQLNSIDMPIEKNLNIPNLNTDSKTQKTQTNLFKIKKFISNQRFQSRQHFSLKPLNFFTVVTVLPFALGLAEFFYKNKPESFFQKNLPVFTFLKPQLDFETVEYISKSNFLNVTQQSFENAKKTFLFGQTQFIAKIKKPKNLNKKNFHSLSFAFIYSNQTVSRNLDELPSSIKSLFNAQESSGLSENFELFSKREKTKKKISVIPKGAPKMSFSTPSNVLLLLNKKESSFPVITEDLSELKKNFKEKKSPKFEKFLNEFLEKADDIFLLDTILTDFTQNQIYKENPGFRIMSGYNYPDMILSDLNWFFFQKAFTGLKFKKSKLPVFSKNYKWDIDSLPATLVETKKINLKPSDQDKVFFSGPALVLDPQRALDWKSHTAESFNLRSWFHFYLSPFNPLVRIQQHFFGIYKSPEFLGEGKSLEVSNFVNKDLLRLTYNSLENGSSLDVFSPKASFAPWTSSFHIPSNLLEKNFFIRGIDFNVSKPEKGEEFVPIIQLQQPQFQCLATNFHLLKSSSQLFFGSLETLDYTIPTDLRNFDTKHVSGRYKKLLSIFSRTAPLLIDNWEPLTTSSWLVVSQLSFAVFIFHTLKGLADNYGRELLGYLLDLVSALGVLDDSLKQEIEILMGQREKGFRIIQHSKKNFTDIAGIRRLLPEIYELVWYLRNSARQFTLSKTLPRGVLLTGPPGTGKTLLVQALAGEAQVPVLVLSGSSLIEPGESGAIKLEMLFQEARQVAPCIVFIDEIETLAQKRSGVVQNPMGSDELLEAVISFKKSQTSQFPEKQELETSTFSDSKQDQLSLLMQFLIELDGIQGRDGVIVIGATNRPEVLDPAILRPGRFDKIVHVGLPKLQKRIEILKLYGKSLGYQSSLAWEYLGQRTAGFTAADLATLMNESTMKAILNRSIHTIETIEHGIDRLTTSQSEKYTYLKPQRDKYKVLSVSSKISILRLAYYQAGKIVVSRILESHPNVLIAYLWPRRTTIRSLQITTNLQNSLFQFARLRELNERVIGSYAGKAAEFLFLESFSKIGFSSVPDAPYGNVNSSTLGLDDLVFAQQLIYCLIEKCSFYSKKFHLQKTITLVTNFNTREFTENKEKNELYNQFVETIQIPPMTQILETQTSSLFSNKENLILNQNAQKHYSIPWWQQAISYELEFVEKNFANWSRLYLYNPEQSDRNPEWFPPDEFYHYSSGLKNIKIAFNNVSKRKIKRKNRSKKANSSYQLKDQGANKVSLPEVFKKADFNWNDVAKITRDYPVHSLVLQGFNKSLAILNQNRELLDKIVIELLYHEILRQPELEKLFKDFQRTEVKNAASKQISVLQQNQKFQIIESNWGTESRKKIPRWIDFASFN